MKRLHVAFWHAYLAVGVIISGLFFLLPRGLALSATYDAIAVSSIVAVLVGIRVNRVPNRAAWYVLASAQILNTFGNFTYDYYDLVKHEPPFPSLADVGYLSSYVVLAAGLLLLIRSRARGHDRNGLIDATIIATGVGLLAWIYLMLPYADDPTLTVLEKLLSIAYPLMDVLILALIFRLVIGAGRRVPTVVLLAASVAFTLSADALYAWAVLAGLWHDGMWISAGWLLGWVFFGTAALHPSVREVGLPSPEPRRTPSKLRLLLLAGASLMAPATITIEVLRGRTDGIIAISAVSAILFLLVVLRMAGLVRDIQTKADLLTKQSQELGEAHTERARLLARMIEAGEQERKLLAAQLHDGPIQRLSAVDLSLHNLGAHIPSEDESGRATVEQLHDRTRLSINELQAMMSELHPPALKERGLSAALSDYIGEINRSTGMNGTVACEVDGRLAPELETTIFRVVQEAVANVVKHSEGTGFGVSVDATNGRVHLQVDDDGKGFVSDPGSNGSKEIKYGLMAMRERIEVLGGTWHLSSTPSVGTRIRAVLPRGENNE